MKDQYFGDVNDYRKYGLLRGLVASTGMSLGVCWLRTPPDGGWDGEFRKYLHAPNKWRHFDPELYDRLSGLVDPAIPRRLEWAEEWELLPRARYHHATLADPADDRAEYFAAADAQLKDRDLWFFDPDNGVEVKSVPYGRKRSSKFLYWREAAAAVEGGRSLVIYQHYPRRPRSVFTRELCDTALSRTGAAAVIPVQTAHVLFLIVAKAAHAPALRQGVEAVSRQWAGQLDATE